MAEEIVSTVIMSILVLCSLLGNSLVIMIIIRNHIMRKPVHFLMANLALCDGLFSFFLIPRFILIHTFQHPTGVTGDFLCKFVTGGNLTWVGGVASVYTLVTISLERYFAVVYPLKSRGRFTMSKAKRAVIASWSIAVLLCFPLFFVIFYNVEEDFCLEAWPSDALQKIYTVTWFVTVGVIPFGSMVFFYSRVALVLWGAGSKQVTRQVMYTSRKKITKIALLVTLIFFITWFSDLAYYLIEGFAGDGFVSSSVAQRVIQIATASNAACNPFIYAFQSAQFRKNIIDILCLRKTRRVSDHLTSMQEMSYRQAGMRGQQRVIMSYMPRNSSPSEVIVHAVTAESVKEPNKNNFEELKLQ